MTFTLPRHAVNKRLVKSLVLGSFMGLLGLVCSALPLIERLELDLGLATLFHLRGARAPPDEAVIVSISGASSRILGLPNEPEAWPRSLHGRLVRNLTDKGARMIAFDLIFDQPGRGREDRAFAQAMRAADNVVLFEYLRLSKQQLVGADGDTPISLVSSDISIEQRIPPIPTFARAAAAVAPFPLPEVRAKVSQVWLFKPGAGDAATLPVVALLEYARSHYRAFVAAITKTWRALEPGAELPLLPGGNDGATIQASALRALLRAHPRLVLALRERLVAREHGMDTQARRVMLALLHAHLRGDSRFIDFYGPPHSVTTVPYYEALKPCTVHTMSGRPIDLRNKAVFVGFAEQSYPEQRDDFYTVFSRTDGLDLSGVEIAATSFANLLDNRGVRPLEAPWWALSILCRGLGVGMLLFWLPGSAAVGGAGFLAVTMAGTAYALFSTYGIWLQLLVPLAVQLPAAMAGALLWQRLDSRRESRRLHRTLGLYLPRGATEALARHAGDVASLGGRSLQGVCMATDAARYTRLSESMQPDALRALLNQYFDVLFAPVRRHGGDVSDVVGDAMLAIWSRGPAPALREAACRAALEIIAALDDFNRTNGEARLPTRIGLHCGPIQLGNVGAVDHFEYRAVGDVVNAASRIEGLSKHLGTRILVSAAMVEDLPGFITRELGEFRLAGKTQSLVIYELLATTGQEADRYRGLREAFARGLHAFRARDWLAAIAAFNACLEHTADDGPARYYLELCQRYQRKPRPANWHGVVSMRRK